MNAKKDEIIALHDGMLVSIGGYVYTVLGEGVPFFNEAEGMPLQLITLRPAGMTYLEPCPICGGLDLIISGSGVIQCHADGFTLPVDEWNNPPYCKRMALEWTKKHEVESRQRAAQLQTEAEDLLFHANQLRKIQEKWS